MKKVRIIEQTVVSPDGRTVAKARSVAETEEDSHSTSHQAVYTSFHADGTHCHSVSYSSTQTTASDPESF
jgi:hypothetical protein